MINFLLNGNHGIGFQIYVICCLIFVWCSLFLGIGLTALFIIFSLASGVGNSSA